MYINKSVKLCHQLGSFISYHSVAAIKVIQLGWTNQQAGSLKLKPASWLLLKKKQNHFFTENLDHQSGCYWPVVLWIVKCLLATLNYMKDTLYHEKWKNFEYWGLLSWGVLPWWSFQWTAMLVRQVLGLPGFPIQKLYGEEMKMNVAAKKIKKTKPASWHKNWPASWLHLNLPKAASWLHLNPIRVWGWFFSAGYSVVGCQTKLKFSWDRKLAASPNLRLSDLVAMIHCDLRQRTKNFSIGRRRRFGGWK